MSRYTVKPRVCINGEVRPPLPGENTTFCAVYFREADGCERWVADVDATHPTTALDTLREIVEDAQLPAQGLLEALESISQMTRALRIGGPDPMDLQGLSDALTEATGIAYDAIAKATGDQP